MENKIIIIGNLEVGGERGRIMHGGGIATSITATEYKDPQKVLKKYGKKDNCDWINRKYGQTKS